MRVIPNSGSNSPGENTIRKKISKLHSRDYECAFWSVHVPDHSYKEFSELDFIIVSHKGVLCIEVKGGRVSYQNGKFVYKDRYNKIVEKKEGPIEQVSSNKKMLQREIKKILSLKSIPLYAHCIMLPDCEWSPDIDPYSLKKELICDIHTINDQNKFETYLNNLYKYFNQKPGYKKSSELNEDDITKIKNFLRPNFDLIKPLKFKVQEVQRNMLDATEEQMMGLINLEENNKVLCQGPAGSGKTLLACKHAKNLSYQNYKVAFVCRNAAFFEYIKSEFEDSQVEIICLERNYSPLLEKRFNCLIIDEGQDMLTIDCLSKVESLLEEDFDSLNSKIYFFMDNNMQSHIYKDYDNSLADIFDNFFKYYLTKNCRNPIEIIKETNALAGTKIISMIKAKSDETRFYPIQGNNKKNHAQALEKVISTFLDKEIESKDITIVTLLNEQESCIQELVNPIYIGDYNYRSTDKINFFDVKSIKGQESDIVIIIDCYDQIKETKFENLFYTALTRALVSAVVISSQNVERDLKEIINNV